MTIKDSDYKELSKLDIGSWFGKEWKGETIPLLREVLDLIHNKKDISICANCNVWDEVKGEELISPEFADEVSISNTNI